MVNDYSIFAFACNFFWFKRVHEKIFWGKKFFKFFCQKKFHRTIFSKLILGMNLSPKKVHLGKNLINMYSEKNSQKKVLGKFSNKSFLKIRIHIQGKNM